MPKKKSKRKRKSRLPKKYIFLVHKYSTYDNKYQVRWSPGKKTLTKKFTRKRDAEKFAVNKAKKLGIKKGDIIVDL